MTAYPPIDELKKICLRESGHPLLCFDLLGMGNNMKLVAKLGRRYNVFFLSPAKSFPHPVVDRLIASHLLGFEVSNKQELKRVSRTSPKAIFLTLRKGDKLGPLSKIPPKREVFLSCDQFAEFEKLQSAKTQRDIQWGLALRISASSALKFQRKRRSKILESRFGVDIRAASEFLYRNRANRWRGGFHFHYGSEKNSLDDYLDLAKASLRLSERSGFRLDFINLGGGLGPKVGNDLQGLLKKLRKIVPRSTRLIFEPGRLFSESFGYAVGSVRSVRIESNFDCQLNLSREGHLRWANPRLIFISNSLSNGLASHGRAVPWKIRLSGPTSSEGDRFCNLSLNSTHFPLHAGDWVIFSGVPGYSVAWNCEFNGVPKAKVIFFNSR